jgi:hypothetical protein
VRLPDQIGEKQPVHAEPQSFLDVLAGPAGHAELIGSMYGWSGGQATWFILTGEPPILQSLTAETGLCFNTERLPTDVWITIKALPHVSPNVVRAAFIKEQRRLTGHRAGRPIASRNLALVNFVSEKIVRQRKRPDWEHLMELWNKRRETERFNSPSQMQSYFNDTADRVFHLDISQDVRRAPDRRASMIRMLSEPPAAPSFFPESVESSPVEGTANSAGIRGSTKRRGLRS